ncbi:MAG: HIT domain-containing protein [Bryobacterales bacterium]|nr:HIT domain-containing protein [Bryobacterales bacterium]
MDYLWSPWRYAYVSQAQPAEGCIFCVKAAQSRDSENFILHRGRLNFVMLNLYPYTTGHMMVAPYAHRPTLEEADPEALGEMIQLTRTAERHLRAVYRPAGLNIGMNIGACAGAGVAGHIHMHVLPRWAGDSNFMSTVAETRVMPEELAVTYGKLLERFRSEPD